MAKTLIIYYDLEKFTLRGDPYNNLRSLYRYFHLLRLMEDIILRFSSHCWDSWWHQEGLRLEDCPIFETKPPRQGITSRRHTAKGLRLEASAPSDYLSNEDCLENRKKKIKYSLELLADSYST